MFLFLFLCVLILDGMYWKGEMDGEKTTQKTKKQQENKRGQKASQ